MTASAHDTVNHPQHYTSVVPGIECIDVTEHFPFCRGNAIKYLWRAGAKGDLVEDLRKAIWYIEREIASHDPHIEGGVVDGASRLGVRGATQAQRSTAGGDSLKVAPAAPETLPVAEEGTSGRPARPAFTDGWARGCAYCGAPSGTADVCCDECRLDKHAHCPSWPSCLRDDYGRDCDATRSSLPAGSSTVGRSGTATTTHQ